MTKTLIDIPDDLMAEAMEALGVSTKAEAVRTALARVARQDKQREFIHWVAETDALGDLGDPEVRAAARR
ncbi:type II toxin-antitoxin system VapB family antitoxin [Nocardioides speluncae]|uniref:type II toxin-antitoxin system VapB family antitoxin n=1 Tax=Nocardioides speluncae TaxID=2670337 RepID=UPI0012B16598|nr:type II toxin-antitoxin system VapB family antitoxin [Nocardioides speluncae]